MVKYCLKRDADEVKVKKPPQRFKEQEEFLTFPKAEPEGPLGLPSEISALGYRFRFTDELLGGYKLNVLRDDGSAVERGVKIRRYFFSFEKSVTDPKNDNVIALKLSSNAPGVLRVTVMGTGDITAEKIAKAAQDLAGSDSMDRMDAALLLARAAKEGQDIDESVIPLALCLGHEDRWVRVDSAYALGEYAKAVGDISAAEGLLLSALNHAHDGTRTASARALAHHYINIGDDARMHVLSNHPFPDVRAVAQGVFERRSA